MDERTSRVNGKASPEELEREIGRLQRELGAMMGELRQRRHELLDWRRHLGRKRGKVAAGAGVIAGALAVKRFIKNRRERKEAERSAGRV